MTSISDTLLSFLIFAGLAGIAALVYGATRVIEFLFAVLDPEEEQDSGAAIDFAVALRFTKIRPGLQELADGAIYHGHRCQPLQLGWRFRQMLRLKGRTAQVLAIDAGQHDEDIVRTWHEAARAENWYRFEKDYGTEEPDYHDAETDF